MGEEVWRNWETREGSCIQIILYEKRNLCLIKGEKNFKKRNYALVGQYPPHGVPIVLFSRDFIDSLYKQIWTFVWSFLLIH